MASLLTVPPNNGRPSVLSPRVWDDMSWLLLLVLVVIVWLTFRDYGITNDEKVQDIYGRMLLSFYQSGFQDLSAFSYKDLYFYGGLFDLVAAALYPVSPLGEYETRHLLCALVGVLGIAGTWRLGRQIGGPRAGFIAAVLLALTGAYFGAMANNTKDVPFAAGMAWTLYFVVRAVQAFPVPQVRTVVMAGVTLGLTMSIRVGAGIVVGYLAAAMAVYGALQWRRVGGRAVWDANWRFVRHLWPVPVIAYAIMAAFWPWAVLSPLNPLLAVSTFAHMAVHVETLLDGVSFWSDQPPAAYVPIYLAVKVPESLMVGLGLAVVAAARCRWRNRLTLVSLLPVVLAAVTPVVLFTVMRPTIYNGIRHFLFVIPPLAVLAALGIDRCWRLVQGFGPRPAALAGAVLGTMALVQAWQLVRLHPNEYVAYNVFAGGLAGAVGRFELDYWGNSLPEAERRLAALLALDGAGSPPPERPYLVAVCGQPLAASYFLPPGLRLAASEEWPNADFFIYTSHQQTHHERCPSILSGQPIVVVEALGVPLSIVKDRRGRLAPGPAAAAAEPVPASVPALVPR